MSKQCDSCANLLKITLVCNKRQKFICNYEFSTGKSSKNKGCEYFRSLKYNRKKDKPKNLDNEK